MRGLLREFADAGGAVLLSSHLLREIEVIADELVVIGRGRLVAQGSKHDLLSAAGTFVRADDGDLAAALHAAGIEFRPAGDGGYTSPAHAETIARAAAHAGVALTELRPVDGGGLEELFLHLTAGDAREDVTA
jgi:ABC-2 type transport system ATP-binding protein